MKVERTNANWERELSYDATETLLDEEYSYQEKNGTMICTGCIGRDKDVSVFTCFRSNIMNIICGDKETIKAVQNWAKLLEKAIDNLVIDITIFDILGAKYSIIIKSYKEVRK